MSGTSDAPAGLKAKIQAALQAELGNFKPRVLALSLASRMLPLGMRSETRANFLRAMGFSVGKGTVVEAMPKIVGGGETYASHLVIGADCHIQIGCEFDLGERISLGDRVTLGHEVLILTTSHELGPREHRAGPVVVAPVTIQRGAWIGPRSIILPGVTVGEGAIVSPGALVNKDVEPNTRVAGIPAKRVEALAP
jgi:maltose O-acetyltransferase